MVENLVLIGLTNLSERGEGLGIHTLTLKKTLRGRTRG